MSTTTPAPARIPRQAAMSTPAHHSFPTGFAMSTTAPPRKLKQPADPHPAANAHRAQPRPPATNARHADRGAAMSTPTHHRFPTGGSR